MFRKLLDNTSESSLANKFRKKRFKYFNELILNLPYPINILDVGGTEDFWKQMGIAKNNDFTITILNINEPEIISKSRLKDQSSMKFIKGDAADLGIFADKSFDVVFSNSVIEHIPEKLNRMKMANEIKRVGMRYFVQTPNYYFPFEPHFLFPFFQFLPESIKMLLLKNFNMGWFRKCRDDNDALELLKNNQLLKLSELKNYFPSGKIIKEKFLFLNKSFLVVKG